MSIDVMSAVWKHSTHKGNALLTLLAISDNADDDGFAFPSYDHLAAKTRLSKRTVQNMVSDLLDTDELSLVTQGTQGRSNYYSVNVHHLRQKPSVMPKRQVASPATSESSRDGSPGGKSGGTVGATEPPGLEPSGLEPSVNNTAASDGDAEMTLPGFAPPPLPPVAAPAIEPEVQEVWDFYVATFADRLRIRDLTDARVRVIRGALKAVNGDVSILKSAILGLHAYRAQNQGRSQDVGIDVIFKTNMKDRSNLTEKIEWWAAQSEGKSDIPMSVPSGHRARVQELAVQILKVEHQPDNEAVRERSEQARAILAERFKLKVISDGHGKLLRFEGVA